jgi:hypothetical protein
MSSLPQAVGDFFTGAPGEDWDVDSEVSDCDYEDEYEAAEGCSDTAPAQGAADRRGADPARAAAEDDHREEGPDAEGSDSEGDDDGEEPRRKKPKKSCPLKEYDPRALSDEEKAAIAPIAFDVEMSSSDRSSGILVDVGGAVEGVGGAIVKFSERCRGKRGEHVAWSDNAIAVHNIKAADVSACRDHVTVLEAFLKWASDKVPEGKVGALVCHGGLGCDLDWIYHYSRRYGVSVPGNIKYTFDTLRIVKEHASHPLNKKRYTGNLLKATLYRLGNLYKAQFGSSFDGEHAAGDDAAATLRLFLSGPFQSRRFTKSGGALPLELVFAKKAAAHADKMKRVNAPAAEGWDESGSEPLGCEEPFGGSRYGPKLPPNPDLTADEARRFPLVALLLLFLPLAFLRKVAAWTNYYGNAQDVVREGKSCRAVSRGHPRWGERRKRYKRAGRGWVDVDEWYILCWLAILIRNAAKGARGIYQNWTEADGLRDPTIADTMDRDSFIQIHQYICFQDYSRRPESVKDKRNKCWKVQPLLTHVSQAFQKLWTIGREMTIDESMILCKSRYVQWKQYMPLKPIKHGIKVFVLCCGATGYVYNFHVYQGRGTLAPADAITSVLLTAELCFTGRILFTDNYYTSVSLAVTLLAAYGVYLVGTFSPRKGAPNPDVFPYSKLTSADGHHVARGWLRRATRAFRQGASNVVVQAILWRDSKVCGFLSTAFIGCSEGSEVLRSCRGAFKTLRIAAHEVVVKYLANYGAVDRADRGMADHNVAIRSSRWVMTVVFWCINAVLWNVWVVARFYMDSDGGRYSEYKGKRQKFQLSMSAQAFDLCLERAAEKHGGLENVGWVNRKALARARKREPTPLEKHLSPANPDKHKLYPLEKGAKKTFCQRCYNVCTDKKLARHERARQSNTACGYCMECSWRYCADCNTRENHLDK